METMSKTFEQRSEERRHRSHENVYPGGAGEGEGPKGDFGRGDDRCWRSIGVHGQSQS
jgi:hypothetical protein